MADTKLSALPDAVLNGTDHLYVNDNGTSKKATVTALNGALAHGSLTGVGSNAHSVIDTHLADGDLHGDHTAIEVQAGTGLSGGGAIDATRVLNLDIAGLTAETVLDGTVDMVAVYDDSVTLPRKVALDDLIARASKVSYVATGGIAATDVQAALTELDSEKATTASLTAHTGNANIHVDHGTVSVTAGAGLAGGGTIDANVALNVDIFGQTTDASPDSGADYVLTWDASAGAVAKVLLANLPTGAGGEINVGANVGTGVGVFDSKALSVLNFRSIDTPGTPNPISVVLNGQTVEVTGPTIVEGPGSATDEAIAIYDATTGKLLKNSGVTIVGGVLTTGGAAIDLGGGAVTSPGLIDGVDVTTLALRLESFDVANPPAGLDELDGDHLDIDWDPVNTTPNTSGITAFATTVDHLTAHLKGIDDWIGSAGGGSLNNVIEDMTPQLGGDLDVNSQTITAALNGNVALEATGTGDITLTTATGNVLINGNTILNTNVSTAEKGDILVYDGTEFIDLNVGVNGDFLKANSATATGLEWGVGAGGVTDIDDLGDVSIGTEATGEYLRWNGSAWADSALQLVDDTAPVLGGTLALASGAARLLSINGGRSMMQFQNIGTGSANFLELSNGEAGDPVILTSDGIDNDVDITIASKGDGNVILNPGATAQAQVADGNFNVASGNILVSGTVDGRDVATDGTKLDGVEALADVTDAANVAAAGAVMDSDISEAEGFVRKTGANAYEAIKSNLGAAVAPGVTDDSAAGYAVGSWWIDLNTDTSYVCLDSTATAAVWKDTSAGAGGGISNVVEDTTPQLGGDLDVQTHQLVIGSNNLLDFADVAATNYLQVANAATMDGPEIRAIGGDTNIDVELIPKGSGVGRVGAKRIVDYTDGSEAEGDAIRYRSGSWAREAAIDATSSGNTAGEYLRNNGTQFVNAALQIADDTGPALGGDLNVGAFSINDTNGNELLEFLPIATAVKNLRIQNANSGGTPKIIAFADSGDAGITLETQGAGVVRVDGNAVLDSSSPIAGLADVDDTGVATGGILRYDGANYVDIDETTFLEGAFPVDDATVLVTSGTDKAMRIDTALVANSTTRVLTMADEAIDLTPDTGSFQSPLPVADTTELVKGSSDASKQVRMEVDGLTTSTTRILTMADQNIDLTPDTGDYQSPLPLVDTTAIVKGSADASKLVRVEADGLTTSTTRVITAADEDIDMTPGTGSYGAPIHVGTSPPADTSGRTLWLCTTSGYNELFYLDSSRGSDWFSMETIQWRYGSNAAKVGSPNTMNMAAITSSGPTVGFFRGQDVTLIGAEFHAAVAATVTLELQDEANAIKATFALTAETTWSDYTLDVDLDVDEKHHLEVDTGDTEAANCMVFYLKKRIADS